jgi:hypothetical protein
MQQVDELKTGISGDGPDNGGGAEPSRVSFSPEQQAKIQSLIDDAYRKAYAKAQRGASAPEEMERLRSEVEALMQEKKAAALLRAISRHNVVDAEEVAELLRERVRIDGDGGLGVAGRSGGVMINASGQPMTLDEYVANWLSERPHHLRQTGMPGAGSQGARFSGTGVSRRGLSDPSVWRDIPREDLDRLLSEGITVQGSSGQSYRFKDVKNPFLEARKRRFKAGRSING